MRIRDEQLGRVPLFILITAVILCTPLLSFGANTIVHSKHDLSVTGPGPMKAPSQRSVCIFCHTTHGGGGDAPMWNRYSSGVTYMPYNSSTIKAEVGQPTGASKLCLSCHDGTIALGMVRNRRVPIPFAGGISTMKHDRPSVLRTDLSDDHPVSFLYDSTLYENSGGELVDPEKLTEAVKLDDDGRVQCTSCHNPHNDRYGNFLVMENRQSALCLSCHDKSNWDGSVHESSNAKWDGRSKNPWPKSSYRSVVNNGCENCHTPHSAAAGERLLRFGPEEDNCYACHTGNVAGKNIRAAFSKASAHPIGRTSGIHDPAEDPFKSQRHVECADCHDPHAATDDKAEAPYASGALAGVSGRRSNGSLVKEIRYEYELCYKCHADNDNRGPARIKRFTPETNTRKEFDQGSDSYHPVEAAGKNSYVPSLIDPLTTASMIYCSDCHNSDAKAKGPHGSKWTPILSRRQVQTDFSKEGPSVYALCYSCHSRNSIMNDESFPQHRLHIRDQTTACTTCHDPHGVQRGTHLINFNLDYVEPTTNGILEFIDNGTRSGSCSLTCHEREHDSESY